MLDTAYPNCMVLDLGTSMTKAGWSHCGEPDLIIPTVVGRGRHKGAMLNLGLKDSYVGRQAQNLRGILSLSQPIKNGLVQHWDDLEALWDFIWEKSRPSHDTSEGLHKVLVSVPPLCPSEDWKKLAEIILESTDVGGVYLANKSVLAMYGGGRTTGVCVDSGQDMTYIVPCWEGNPIRNATLIQKLGGNDVTDRLLTQLSDGKYSFPDDTFLIWNKRGRTRGLTVATRREVVREAKEKYCRISEQEWRSNSTMAKNVEEQVLRLPDGNIVVVGHEAYSAPEIIFKPELMGPSNKKSSALGLHELVYSSISKCEERLRNRLLSNIMLTGGNSLIPGMDARLKKELSKLLPDNVNVRVQAQNGREHFAWDGGAHLCGLSSFQGLWLTKQDLKENGADLINNSGINLKQSESSNDVTMNSPVTPAEDIMSPSYE